MEMSPEGLAMLTRLEGSENVMYHDQVGLPTIGVGHLLTKSELSSGKINLGGIALVRWADGLSLSEMNELLNQDLADTVEAVSKLVKVPLTQPQFDALVSFAFNVGAGALAISTLLKKLNRGDYASVPSEMRKWVWSKGRQLSTLKERRETEIALWETAA